MYSPVLSTQQLVDCTQSGCNGGWMRGASDYWQNNYISDDVNYPYVGVQQTCKWNKDKSVKSGVKITGKNLPSSADDGVFNILKTGPLSVCVNVQDSFFSYSNGIYDAPCTTECNHAVVLYGWNNIEGDYWILRNSWGTSWGVRGYFNVRDRNACNSSSCLVADNTNSLQPIVTWT